MNTGTWRFTYINVHGTFYHLCSLLEGCSRHIVRWEIREQITEKDVQIILQRAKEKFPDPGPGLSPTSACSLSPENSKS